MFKYLIWLCFALVACTPTVESPAITVISEAPTSSLLSATATSESHATVTATSEAAPPSPEAPEAATATSERQPTSSGPCQLTAQSEVTAYSRPSVEAGIFGTLSAGMSALVTGRTADGWLGFEPGVAQAGNFGIFRLRWVEQSDALTLEGVCDQVPTLVGPPPNVCFTMSPAEVSVFAEANPDSTVVATLADGDYAAVIGQNAEGWRQVDLSIGSTGIAQMGWIQPADINLNGPCD